MRYLRTSDLARAVGVHPNTVRRYVDRGLLPPITRSPAGYRCFTPRHLECLRLACQVYRAPFPGMALHQSGKRIVEAAVGGDLKGARELASQLLNLVRAEQAQAELAADLLERWAFGPPRRAVRRCGSGRRPASWAYPLISCAAGTAMG